MAYKKSPSGTYLSFWDSTPVGKSIDLRLCQYDELSPQLILEYKVLHSAIHLQKNSRIQFLGTLISDDESQRLTYVIDRLLSTDSINEIPNHQILTGEFLIPVLYDNKNTTATNNLIQNGIKEINAYCYSSLPIELHRFAYLCGQISSHHSSSVNTNLSFILVTIKTSFTLTPINSDYIHILPTALLKTLNSSYMNQPHFGYCSLDRTTKNNILLVLENDPQTCSLPLVGIWVSGITDIQCAFVWSACVRYCMNSSLKQRLRSGKTPQQAFLLACYLPSSCSFYEVCLKTNDSTPSMAIEYELWTCSKQIIVPNSSLHQYDANAGTQFPYDFEFKRVHNGRKNNGLVGNSSPPVQSSRVQTNRTPLRTDDNCQDTLTSPNTNGSLFGFPRLPPKQSTQQSPSWDALSNTPMTTPQRIVRQSNASPAPSTIPTDNRWKEELVERMHSYETHIQSLTALVSQLVATQTQQNLTSSSIKECTKHDVAVQSEPPSSNLNNHVDESLSMTENNQHSSPSPKFEHREQQTSFIDTTDRSPFIQFQSPSVARQQQQPIIDYSSFRKSPPPLSVSTDLNPVDILKPIFRFIDNQQQKQQQGSISSFNPTDTTSLKMNNEETDNQTENMFDLANVIQQKQQHVTSTRTTGISFISNGVQMQFINQQSSTTTVYPQSQSASVSQPPPLPIEPLPTSPQKSENNLSIEVHSLEMKYLEDDQLAVAIECDRQSQTSINALPQTAQVVDKSLSFGTEEYLQRYGLFTDSNRDENDT